MAIRPVGEKRKRRCLMATDAEWARIGEDARAAGLTISDYINRSLETASAGSAEDDLPPSMLRRLAQAVLVLERLEWLRLEQLGVEEAGVLRRRLLAEADAWLDAETVLE